MKQKWLYISAQVASSKCQEKLMYPNIILTTTKTFQAVDMICLSIFLLLHAIVLYPNQKGDLSSAVT